MLGGHLDSGTAVRGQRTMLPDLPSQSICLLQRRHRHGPLPRNQRGRKRHRKTGFAAWLAPLHNLEATTVAGATAPATKQPGGTDHTSFTWIGLPGFKFIQDPMEYRTRTHFSNMDLYDRVQPGDLMQGSAIMAW